MAWVFLSLHPHGVNDVPHVGAGLVRGDHCRRRQWSGPAVFVEKRPRQSGGVHGTRQTPAPPVPIRLDFRLAEQETEVLGWIGHGRMLPVDDRHFAASYENVLEMAVTVDQPDVTRSPLGQSGHDLVQ